jgi:hypothetical protein
MTLVTRCAEAVAVLSEGGREAGAAVGVKLGDAVCPKRVLSESKIGTVQTATSCILLVQFI